MSTLWHLPDVAGWLCAAAALAVMAVIALRGR